MTTGHTQINVEIFLLPQRNLSIQQRVLLLSSVSEVNVLSHDVRQLVHRCLAGKQNAILELFERFYGQVYGLCYQMLGQRQDAEDATQETFVRVLRNLEQWDQDRDFEPWLWTIAVNQCRTSLARRMRRPTPQPLYQALSDQTHEIQSAQQLAEEINRALLNVRLEYRQAFFHFHEGKLSYSEISDVMEVPLGTVKTWVHRARRGVIQQLRDRGIVWETRRELRRN